MEGQVNYAKHNTYVNERKTETIVREHLRKTGYYDNPHLSVDEQQSDNSTIRNLLKNASKSLTGNLGKPEFLIWHKNKNLVIVIECKASFKDHASTSYSEPSKYAVDGALHYASFLKKEFNVIAIGVSGESESQIKTSVFSWPKGSNRYISRKYDKITTFDEYEAIFGTQEIEIADGDLTAYAKELHDIFREKAKLKETEKPLLVSALLLALDYDVFRKSYKNNDNPEVLAKSIVTSIEHMLDNSNLDPDKISLLVKEFESVVNKPELLKKEIVRNDISYNNNLLFKFLFDLENRIYPIMKEIRNIDLIGDFYSEFVRYTGGDGRGLGIVLTPKHVTRFFADLAEVDSQSVVLDICAGTGGFLIAALEKMFSINNGDLTVSQINEIYSRKLIGFETQQSIFALACSNMIIRGDGKTNIFCENSLKNKELKKFNANVGMINPPYGQSSDEKELAFVEHMLDALEKGGRGIAIVPVSSVMATKKSLNYSYKEKILSKHKLEGVISMPEDLFYPTAVVTCILVFRAWERNDKTVLHCLRSDGFKKTKNKGRVDTGLWKKISEEALDAIKNKNLSNPYKTVLRKLNASDEWYPEAYVETDYSQLSEAHFTSKIKNYSLFLLAREKITFATNEALEGEKFLLETGNFHKFKLGDKDLFTLKRAKGCRISDYENGDEIPFVSTTHLNNGIMKFVNREDCFPNDLNMGNVISIANNGSVGETFYQDEKFLATSDVTIFDLVEIHMNPYLAMFISTMISFEKFRFNYGYKWGLERMRNSEIFLPFKCIGKEKFPDYEFMVDFIKSLPFSKNL